MYYPIQCYIELTKKCNLSCSHCFAEGSPTTSNELTLDDVKKIYSQIKNLGVIYVNISGGEPLLNNELFKIIEYAADQPYETCLLTNGTLWNSDHIKKLKKSDPNNKITIQISMDGNFKTMLKHRNINKNQYDNIFKTMKELKLSGFKVTTLLVADTITADNLIETAYELLRNNYVDSAQIVPLFITGRALNNIELLDNFWKKWFNIVKEVTLIKKNSLWKELSNRLNIGFFNFYELVIPLIESGLENEIYDTWGLNIYNLSEYRKQIRRNFYCEAGKSELVISCDKEIFPCVASIRTKLKCGNINKYSIKNIWENSEILKYFRNNKSFLNLSEPCLSCKYKNFCGGGCKLTSLSLHNDLKHIDERCPIVVKYKKT